MCRAAILVRVVQRHKLIHFRVGSDRSLSECVITVNITIASVQIAANPLAFATQGVHKCVTTAHVGHTAGAAVTTEVGCVVKIGTRTGGAAIRS